MAIPEVTLTEKDGALGVAPLNGNNIVALIGASSAGTINTPSLYSDPTQLKTDFGTGPLVEAAAHILNISGGPVLVCKAPSSTAGVAGAVTLTGTGTSVVTVTGAPLDAYDVRVQVLTAAAAVTSGVGTFKYSLDGGRTYSAEISLPTNGQYAIPGTGMTLVFATGTLVLGDVYSFTTTGPSYTTTELGTAATALFGGAQDFFLLYAVGVPATLSAGLAMFGALDAAVQSGLTTYKRPVAGLMQAEDDTDTNIKSNYAAQASTRMVLAAGYEYLVSSLNGAQYKRPAAHVIAARAALAPPSEDLARVRSGPVRGVSALIRDEFKTQGMDVARFSTLRTIVGKAGFYITNANIFSSPGSDFQYLQHRRVMDIGYRAARTGMLDYLSDDVRVNKATGLILEQDAQKIDDRLTAYMRDALTQPGYASDAYARLDRTVNVLSTRKLTVKYRVVPLGYFKAIDGEIGFDNPALTLA